jgi:hypothetical protein
MAESAGCVLSDNGKCCYRMSDLKIQKKRLSHKLSPNVRLTELVELATPALIAGTIGEYRTLKKTIPKKCLVHRRVQDLFHTLCEDLKRHYIF